MTDEKIKEIDQIERDLVDDETIARINSNFKDATIDETEHAVKDEAEETGEDLQEQGLEIYDADSKAKESAESVSEESPEEPKEEEQETLDDVKKEEETEETEDIEEEPAEKEESEPVKTKAKKEIKHAKPKVQEKQKPQNHNVKKHWKKPIILIKPKHNGKDNKKDDKMKSKKPIFVKKENKKDDKPKKSKKEQKSFMWMLWIALGVIVLIAIFWAVIFLSVKSHSTLPAGNTTTNEIAATVNGEPIYLKDINSQYSRLSSSMQSIYTKDVLLNQSIDELLLLQEAKAQNIIVSDQEVTEAVANFKEENNLTQNELEKTLTSQNLSLNYLKDALKKQTFIEKLLNKTILNNITITQAQIEVYYNSNKDIFTVPEQVKAAHILVLTNANATDAQAYAKITQIKAMLNDTNFCELVKKYSQDPGSINSCGEYTFGRNEMVPEFENASFNLKINEITIVKTIYGYHLIKKLDYFPSYLENLNNVSVQIKQGLYAQAAQDKFDVFITNLRAKATIVNYMNGKNTTIAQTNLDAFAKCLTANNATFYGASWCPHCSNQKEMFGNSLQYIHYVECADANNPQTQTPECNAANITGYPTWTVNSQQYPGEQSLDTLAALTGCKE